MLLFDCSIPSFVYWRKPMRNLIVSLFLFVFSFSLTASEETKWHLGPNGETRFIVVLKDQYDPEDFILSNNLKVERVWKEGLKGFTVLINSESEMNLHSVVSLTNLPEVDFIEIDSPVRLIEPKRKGKEISINQGKQQIPWGIRKVGAFRCVKSCSKKKAFVIDTGIDLKNPDLRVNRQLGFSAFQGSPDDDNGHGTHVAGTIGAVNNGIGVVGVAAGVQLVPIKVLSGSGSGSTSGVIAGVNHAFKRGRKGDVANMSLGGGISPALDKAVKKASRKLIFTLAAGNERSDAKTSSPGRVNGRNIYTISAFDRSGRFARFSNYGSAVDKAEPGVGVLSTIPGGKLASWSGTSMAAPHAAGILLRNGRFGPGCEKVKNDPDGKPDCIGVLPR